jgi:hypothetical protein
MEEKIKWLCQNCGAVHERTDAVSMVLSKSGFTPVRVKEEPKEVPKPMPRDFQKPIEKKPQVKPAEYIDDEEEEVEDLRID